MVATAPSAASRAMSTTARGLVRAGRAVRWYLDGLTGQSRYASYLAHARATHPDEVPMTEREFWVSYHRDQETNPQGRCC